MSANTIVILLIAIFMVAHIGMLIGNAVAVAGIRRELASRGSDTAAEPLVPVN